MFCCCSRPCRQNTSGYHGVGMVSNNRWCAILSRVGRRWNLGYHDTKEEAARQVLKFVLQRPSWHYLLPGEGGAGTHNEQQALQTQENLRNLQTRNAQLSRGWDFDATSQDSSADEESLPSQPSCCGDVQATCHVDHCMSGAPVGWCACEVAAAPSCEDVAMPNLGSMPATRQGSLDIEFSLHAQPFGGRPAGQQPAQQSACADMPPSSCHPLSGQHANVLDDPITLAPEAAPSLMTNTVASNLGLQLSPASPWLSCGEQHHAQRSRGQVGGLEGVGSVGEGACMSHVSGEEEVVCAGHLALPNEMGHKPEAVQIKRVGTEALLDGCQEGVVGGADDTEELKCVVCLGSIPAHLLVYLLCNHYFCKPCIQQCLMEASRCPLCRFPAQQRGWVPAGGLSMLSTSGAPVLQTPSVRGEGANQAVARVGDERQGGRGVPPLVMGAEAQEVGGAVQGGLVAKGVGIDGGDVGAHSSVTRAEEEVVVRPAVGFTMAPTSGLCLMGTSALAHPLPSAVMCAGPPGEAAVGLGELDVGIVSSVSGESLGHSGSPSACSGAEAGEHGWVGQGTPDVAGVRLGTGGGSCGGIESQDGAQAELTSTTEGCIGGGSCGGIGSQDGAHAELTSTTEGCMPCMWIRSNKGGSGFKGVSYLADRKTWVALVPLGNGKRKQLGSFKTVEQAATAVLSHCLKTPSLQWWSGLHLEGTQGSDVRDKGEPAAVAPSVKHNGTSSPAYQWVYAANADATLWKAYCPSGSANWNLVGTFPSKELAAAAGEEAHMLAHPTPQHGDSGGADSDSGVNGSGGSSDEGPVGSGVVGAGLAHEEAPPGQPPDAPSSDDDWPVDGLSGDDDSDGSDWLGNERSSDDDSEGNSELDSDASGHTTSGGCSPGVDGDEDEPGPPGPETGGGGGNKKKKKTPTYETLLHKLVEIGAASPEQVEIVKFLRSPPHTSARSNFKELRKLVLDKRQKVRACPPPPRQLRVLFPNCGCAERRSHGQAPDGLNCIAPWWHRGRNSK